MAEYTLVYQFRTRGFNPRADFMPFYLVKSGITAVQNPLQNLPFRSPFSFLAILISLLSRNPFVGREKSYCDRDCLSKYKSSERESVFDYTPKSEMWTLCHSPDSKRRNRADFKEKEHSICIFFSSSSGVSDTAISFPLG